MLPKTAAPLLFVMLMPLVVCSPASAAITAFWVPVASGDGSVGSMYPSAATTADPVLLGMQTWDLRVLTSGDWSEAGMRAVLPLGAFYRGTSTEIHKPEIITPPREFWTYATVPGEREDTGYIAIFGGFPPNQPISNGTSNGANVPGTFSCRWGDFINDPPSPSGGYQIARLTFPLGMIPDVLTMDQDPISFSRTSQTNPASTTAIPDIPEPCSLGIVSAAFVLGLRRGRRGGVA